MSAQGCPDGATDLGVEGENALPLHLRSVYLESCKHLYGEQSHELKQLLLQFQDVFAKDEFDLGNFTEVQHTIDTVDAKPARQCIRRTLILDMTDNETEMLATHLGHDPKTHKENYRLTHSTRELSLVSQLLLLVESGAVNKWKGKKLSEIPIEDLPDLEEDEEDEDEEIVEDAVTNACPIEPSSPVPMEPSAYVPKDPTGYACDLPDPEEESLTDATANILPMELSGSYPIKQGGSAPNDQGSSACRMRKSWSHSEQTILRKKFHRYLKGIGQVHKVDLIHCQNISDELSKRSLAQIRTKLNNMKLGKSC